MSPNTSTRGAKAAPARRKLTDRFIKTVKPDAKRTLFWDTVQAGLALSVEPSGHKAYKLVYAFQGRSRWHTLGAADRLGLKEARLIAREKMAEVYRGVDVQAERQAARKADTFDELAGRYREEYAKLRNRSWRQADTLVRTYLLPRWAKLPAHTITRADVRAVFNKITRNGSPVLANQVLAAASAVFAWALKNDVANLQANPCSGIERNRTKARERVLSDRELPLFWAAFADAGLVRCCALRMILLTGQRPGEIRHMRWEHIEDGWWTLPGGPDGAWPGTKNGQTHRVWLSQPAQAILDELRDGQIDGFVFPGSRGNAIAGLDAA
jgi:integrase